MIHHEFESLVRRIDDERVPVEALDDDYIFNTKIVIWETLLLPGKSIARIAQEFSELNILSHLEA